MKIAVTGASGQLGSAVTEVLKRTAGVTPIGVARSPAKAGWLEVEVREGDYNRPDQLEKAFRGIQSVLLVSGMAPADERLRQHKTVIDCARLAGVEYMVFSGIVPGESGGGFNPIQQTSLATEEHLKQSGMTWSIGRNGIYIEPDLEYIAQYRGRQNCQLCWRGQVRVHQQTRARTGLRVHAYRAPAQEPNLHIGRPAYYPEDARRWYQHSLRNSLGIRVVDRGGVPPRTRGGVGRIPGRDHRRNLRRDS